MSAYYEVYVAAASTLDEVAQQVADVLSLPLLPREYEYRVAAGEAGLSFDIEINDLDDHIEAGLEFSHYPHLVTVRPYNVRGREQARAAAEDLFDALGRLGWSRMLMFDAQVLLRRA